jgi:hypothetical protein
MSRIRVTIDHVVLRGMAPADRKAFLEGLQSELTSLLADPTTRAQWAKPHRTPVVRLGGMPFTSGPSGGRRFGVGVARAIGRRLAP